MIGRERNHDKSPTLAQLHTEACKDALLAPAEDPRRVFPIAHQPHLESTSRSRPHLDDLRRSLENGFADISFGAGERVLHELAHEFDQLTPILERRKATDPLSVAHIPALAEETYRQGRNVLEDALELGRAIHLPDRPALEAEIERLRREVEARSTTGDESAIAKMREETLTSRTELLAMIEQQHIRIDQLIHQADQCQSCLQRTRIELAALRAERSETSVSTVTETLRLTISQAREVREEMKRLGY